ncbi:MAG: ACT domain-containing protein [bacterium]
MAGEKNSFYVIKWEFLPDVFRKTLEVKELLSKGEVKTVNEAVQVVGISRSAYYKYKDGIFPFYQMSEGRIVTLSFLLDHKPGVLSRVLNIIAGAGGNILMINQGIPLQGMAHVSVSIETATMDCLVEALMDKIRSQDGVKKVELLAQN